MCREAGCPPGGAACRWPAQAVVRGDERSEIMPRLSAKSRHVVAALLVLAGAALLAGPAAAADYKIGSLDVTQPWARATPKGASTGAAYMTITKTGSKPPRRRCAPTLRPAAS